MFVAVMAIVAAGFTACGNSTPKASLKTDVDTMSYAIGMAQTQGLKDYLVGSLGVDTAYMSEFIKGLNEGVNAGENKKKAAYYAGIQIGQQISNRMLKGINHEVFGDDSTKTISLKNFMAGFVSGTTGKKGLMTIEEAQETAQRKMQEIKARELEKVWGPNKEAGEKFLVANAKKAAYYAGIQIGQQISNRMVKGINREVFGDDSTKTISLKNFMAAFISGTTGKKGLMTVEEAQQLAQQKMQEIKAREMMKTYGPNKEAGEKFLKENAKKEGVKTLANGIQYKVLTEGTGAVPADTSLVKVNYEGRLIDGTVFDSSYKRNEPAVFRANQVIKGWTEALCHMPAGSVWEVYIPQDMAYGEREQGDIKPFSVLIFKIELLEANAKR